MEVKVANKSLKGDFCRWLQMFENLKSLKEEIEQH